MEKLKEMLPSNPFFIPAERANKILAKSGLTMEELLLALIPIAKPFAVTPISGYHVGEAALGESGNIYLGMNIEFPLPLNFAVHGEQSLVVNARRHGEKRFKMMALPAAPCGHCRQFLNEMDGSEQLLILTPDSPPMTLSSLLPEAFGPKDLGLKGNLLAQPTEYPCFSHESPLVREALKAALSSYAPYSESRSGVAIQIIKGKIYAGPYLENVAFNPSLSPLQVALVPFLMNQHDYEEISKVVLVEKGTSKISQEAVTRALLMKIAPKAHFQLEHREF